MNIMHLIKVATLLLGVIGQNGVSANEQSKLRGRSVIAGEDHQDAQRKLQHSNHFKESVCNADIATATCTSIQTFLNTTQPPTDAEVKIPCGSCVTMDIADNSMLHFPHGLNVVGKLHIPENASFELRTKYVLVQGYMTMDPPSVGQTTIPRSDGAKIKVVLEGTEDVTFIPDEDGDNSMLGQKNIGSKPFAVAGGKLDINAIDDACPSWTKLDSLSQDNMEITLTDPLASECWAAGAELLFTPDEVGTPRNTQVATIASSDPTTGVITLASPLPTRSTSVQDNFGEHFAVEVALLTRRITFEPADNANLIGGHTIILHTNQVVQNIKGVEFKRFGQQGRLGRYPVHFHMAEGVHGSTVSKNLVRESNQRCYVIHGSHGVSLQDNVAFDTFGHCFMIEDGGEWGNKFIGNLGSKTKIPALKISATESDDQPTTFWMPNPVNDFIGNVAAGSDSMGFWLEPMLRGPSKNLAINAGFNPVTAPMGKFDNNKAHSNVGNGIAFYPHGYMPWNHGGQIMNGLVATKNAAPGIRVGASNQLHFHGAYIADNGGGIENSGGANNVVRDSIIERVSGHQRSLLAKGRGGRNPCGVGVTFPNDKDHKGQGSEFYNVTFRNFDPWIHGNPSPTGTCTAAAIGSTTISPRYYLYSMKIKFNELKFEGEGSSYPNHRLSVCGAASSGFTGFAFDDLDGSISPDGTPGTFLQQSDPTLKAFKPDNCRAVGGCLLFCPASCYRHVTLEIPVTDVGKTAVVTRSDGLSTTIPRKPYPHAKWTRYGTALQGGYSYDITFVDGAGNPTWPISLTPRWYEAPGCSPNLRYADVALVPPSPSDKPSSSPTISTEPTTSSNPTTSPMPTNFPTLSTAPTNPIEACYLSSVCSEGFTDRGLAGIIAQSDSIGFLRGVSYGGSWTWYHPRLCCGRGVPTDTLTKAMCAKHGENSEHVMGHWMTAGSPDPYLAGGGNNGPWDWRHPRTCPADSPSVCVFSEVDQCRPGHQNWGEARIIMHASSTFPFKAGAYNSDWNYHTPWLCCTEGVELTSSPTPSPTLNPTISNQPSPTVEDDGWDYIEIANWRVARVHETSAHSHFSIASDNLRTSKIFRGDGTAYPGPRSDFNGWDMNSVSGPTQSGTPVEFGNKAVQVRDWRIRQINTYHLSVTHESGNVARIYRADGTLHGKVNSYSGYNQPLGEPTCAYLTSSYLQIGDWRFGARDANHLSVTNKNGNTAVIYRTDGLAFSGPRTDFSAWALPEEQAIKGSKEGC